MSDEYESFEKAVARHDDDEWLPKRIYEKHSFVLARDGTYGLIVWHRTGRFEFRGFKSRRDAEEALEGHRYVFSKLPPGEYEVRNGECFFVRPAQRRYH